jgi:hypothetical protein
MRGKLIISAVVVALLGVAAPAVADYFYPGRIIIGYSGGGTGGIKPVGGNAMVGPECLLEQELQCECEPGMPVLEACHFHGVDTGCLTPDMPYLKVIQPGPVVFDQGEHTLGTLICGGKVDDTARIVLPKPGG